MHTGSAISGSAPVLSVPRTRDSEAAPSHGTGVVPEEEFLRAHAARIEDELFQRRFVNWRFSLAGLLGLIWITALIYRLLDPAANTPIWALLGTASLLLIAVLCLVYERTQPARVSAAAQRKWLLAWTLGSCLAGGTTGLLPWFLPAEHAELQLSGALVLSVLIVAFVATRANRVLIHATVATHTLALSLSLALHTRLYWAIPLSLLFNGLTLVLILLLNNSMRRAVGEHLYARYLHGELQHSHDQQLQARQREATLHERARMVSDLHDGFGAQLLTSLRLLEGGQLDRAGTAAVVRECVDDLRLMVDAQEPAARNLATLLGMLRYRLQPRVQAAGLRLNWQIAELPDEASLPATQSLDLLRILQQAVTNVLQHAGAREVTIALVRHPACIEIEVADDGRGFDAATTSQGRGLANMRRRAARLAALLTIGARDGGGTALRLQLPWPPAAQRDPA